MNNMVKIVNTLYFNTKVIKRVNFKSSHHKEIFFSISLIMYLYNMMNIH